jgi:hypothetical protein
MGKSSPRTILDNLSRCVKTNLMVCDSNTYCVDSGCSVFQKKSADHRPYIDSFCGMAAREYSSLAAKHMNNLAT